MLPIHEALPDLKAALSSGSAAVLVAPPGAGKTTVVPLELLGEPWVGGEDHRPGAPAPRRPRRRRPDGDNAGRAGGGHCRLPGAHAVAGVGPKTRIEVVTEGVFTRMILADPELAGVACVIFDEFHERSLDADLGLALALDSQRLLREDLRLLVMSATLDGAAVARLLDDAPVIESQGRMFPVDTRYLGRDDRLRLEDQMVRAVETALAEQPGSLLVFLPGQGEILRTAERLRDRIAARTSRSPRSTARSIPRDQDRAIQPAAARRPQGRAGHRPSPRPA